MISNPVSGIFVTKYETFRTRKTENGQKFRLVTFNAEPENNADEHDSGDESTEDESEVLEESPCGRWQKRREEIKQRDIPGIDIAFLAMDTEEGVEVVWNEVTFSEKKNLKSQQEKIKHVFDNLVDLDHPNLVKFHKYWMDIGEGNKKPRVIFITEYMSSGSLKQFLKKTKKNNKSLKAWKRWTTQILSALSYLHSCDPPIIHGNLSCDTIFIQHNGLIKIGSIAPDAIHDHVKTCLNEAKNMYYIAPEYGAPTCVTTAVDIYSFGICALEMALLNIMSNGDSGGVVTRETISKKLDLIEDPLQKDFISKCLAQDPNERLTARELLFHAILFEVHSLKLLAAHCYTKNADTLPEPGGDEGHLLKYEPQQVIAEIQVQVGPAVKEPVLWRAQQVPTLVEMDKFLEDVRNGIYPLVAFASDFQPPAPRPRAVSPEVAESVKSETPEPVDVETRMVVSMWCTVKNNDSVINLTLLLKMDDKMNRQLCCDLAEEESVATLAEELVYHGFINELDRERIAWLMDDTIRNRPLADSPSQMLIAQMA